MNMKEAKEKLKMTDDEINKMYVNPLEVFKNRAFDRTQVQHIDYRNEAINDTVKSCEAFHSECNTITDLATRLIKIKCPYCGTPDGMKFNHSSGSSEGSTITWRCECGVEISVSMPNDAITVNPKDRTPKKKLVKIKSGDE